MHEPLPMRTGGPHLHRHAILVPAVYGHSLVDPRELIGLALLLGAYGASLADTQAEYVQFLNIVGPSALIVILLLGCWWQLAREPRSLWQPLFWFRLGCVLYYGAGALAPYVANDATVQSIRSLYAFSDEEAFKVGLINVCCILTVLLVAAVFSGHRSLFDRSPAQSNTLLFAALFLMVGGITRYLIVLPWSLGLTDIVPGLVLPLAKSYVVGLFLVILAGLRGSRIALALALILIPIDVGVGLLTFTKTEVLITLIFSYLAVLHHKLTLPRTLLAPPWSSPSTRSSTQSSTSVVTSSPAAMVAQQVHWIRGWKFSTCISTAHPREQWSQRRNQPYRG